MYLDITRLDFVDEIAQLETEAADCLADAEQIRSFLAGLPEWEAEPGKSLSDIIKAHPRGRL